MKSRILVLLIGNIRYDGRVKKIISSLQKFEYEIILVVTDFDEDDSFSNYNYKIHVVNPPSGPRLVDRIRNKFRYRKSIDRIIKQENPDFIHCNDTTIFYVSRWLKRIKIVYDSHELLIELEVGLMRIIKHLFLKRILANVYKIIIPQIDRLNYFYFRNKSVISKDQIYLLENFPLKPQNVNNNYFQMKYGFYTTKTIISYVGVINKERKILDVIKAIQLTDNMVFFIIGPCDPVYKEEILGYIHKYDLMHKVFLKKPIPNEEVLHVSQSSDIGICFYTDTNLNSYFCASNKLYENLNNGMTVLTNNVVGTIRIIEHGKNGYIIDQISESEIVKALNVLSQIDKPQPTEYFWENQEKVLLDVYSSDK